jgi:hypothetical protein
VNGDAITAPGRDKVRPERSIAALAVAVLMVVCAGCRADPSTARGTAERFLDAHYVEIDLPSALPFTSGVARQKVEQEIALTKGVEIDDTTRKPIVRYALLEEHPDDEGGTKFLYRGKILLDGSDGFERRWLVTVRQEPPGYRVTNYQEFNE